MNSFKELYESLDVDTAVSIKIKKEQIEYCFAAESFDEFMIRYCKLIDWAVATINDELIKKRINEIPKQLKKSAQYTFYVDTDTAYVDYKQKISSIYGTCCKDKSILTKINKKLRIAKEGK